MKYWGLSALSTESCLPSRPIWNIKGFPSLSGLERKVMVSRQYPVTFEPMAALLSSGVPWTFHMELSGMWLSTL